MEACRWKCTRGSRSIIASLLSSLRSQRMYILYGITKPARYRHMCRYQRQPQEKVYTARHYLGRNLSSRHVFHGEMPGRYTTAIPILSRPPLRSIPADEILHPSVVIFNNARSTENASLYVNGRTDTLLESKCFDLPVAKRTLVVHDRTVPLDANVGFDFRFCYGK